MIERDTRWVRRFVGQGYEPLVLQQREREWTFNSHGGWLPDIWSDWADVPTVEETEK